MKKRILTIALITLIVQMSFSQKSTETVRDNFREFTLKSETLQREIIILIWLPNDYDSNNENYGVHYVIGGENRFEYYVGAYNYFSLTGDFPKSIIIRAIPNPSFNNNFQEIEKANSFVSYLQNELFPYIDKEYRTNSFRSLWGQSNSGTFTLYCFLKNPDLFTAYFMSAPYGLENVKISDIEKIDANSQYSKYLYMSFGTEDDKGQLEQYSNFKKNIDSGQFKNLIFNLDILDSENHQSIILRNIPDALQAFYSDTEYMIKNYGSFQIEALKKHYSEMSQKYGFEIKAPEEKLTGLAFQMYRRKHYQKAENILLYCIEIYPETKSVKYNLLGGVYEKGGDTQKSIRYYEKDLEIYPEKDWTKNKLKELDAK